MPFTDKTLTCRDCGEEFLFTAGEQEFYQEKGFQHQPSRCPSCRAARRQNQGSSTNRPAAIRTGPGPGAGETPGWRGGGGGRPRQMYPAVCDQCGKETTVPFQPRGDRPVYCRDCFQSMRR